MASSGSQAHSRRLPSTTPPQAPQLLAKVRKLSLFGGSATRVLRQGPVERNRLRARARTRLRRVGQLRCAGLGSNERGSHSELDAPRRRSDSSRAALVQTLSFAGSEIWRCACPAPRCRSRQPAEPDDECDNERDQQPDQQECEVGAGERGCRLFSRSSTG